MQKIVRGIQYFQQYVYPKQQPLFERLCSGQSPEALFISCSDSRIALDLITQTGPGDLFVCRNAGNIVPVYGDSNSVAATVEYAVRALGVRHIVVCGHSDCGAMKALLHPESLEQMPKVKAWLENAEGARRAARDLHVDLGDKELLTAVTRLNVQLQMDHLRAYPHVFARIQSGNLTIHGWIYDIRTGQLEVWDEQLKAWRAFSDAFAVMSKHAITIQETLIA
jgi:carbonic anhydrase